jgi:hypothetical protein
MTSGTYQVYTADLAPAVAAASIVQGQTSLAAGSSSSSNQQSSKHNYTNKSDVDASDSCSSSAAVAHVSAAEDQVVVAAAAATATKTSECHAVALSSQATAAGIARVWDSNAQQFVPLDVFAEDPATHTERLWAESELRVRRIYNRR